MTNSPTPRSNSSKVPTDSNRTNTSAPTVQQEQQTKQTQPTQQSAQKAANDVVQESSLFFGCRTDVGRVREHNEDSLVVMPPLFAVADGMGGHEAGEVASEIAIQTISELAPKHPDAEAFTHAVQAANLNVLKAPAKGIGREGMGTTFTGAILEKERLLIAQVGDSRAYLLHQGRLQQITRDHSLMADLIEAGQLTPAEARVHPNRSVITRAIGSDPRTLPDIYELNVSAGDRLLLCSDGLNAMVEDGEIESILRRIPNPQTCADALADAALEAGGLDNVTVIVANIQGFSQKKERKRIRKSRALFTFLTIALVALLALAAFGGYQYVNNSAYLIEENGKVSVYRGLPDELFGMPLSSLEKTTDVEVSKLQPGVANRIKEGMKVDNLEEADRLIQAYQEEIAKSQQTAQTANSTSNTNASSSSTSNSSNSSTTSTSNSSNSNSSNTRSSGTTSAANTTNTSSGSESSSSQNASQGGN